MFTHSSAYPLAGLCALLNNLIEIRRWAFSQQQQQQQHSINTTQKKKTTIRNNRRWNDNIDNEQFQQQQLWHNQNNKNKDTSDNDNYSNNHNHGTKKTTTYATPTIITTKKAVKRTMDLELKSSYKYKTKQWQKINATFSVTRSSCATSTNARFPRGLTALGPGRLPWRCSCHYCLLFKSKSTV